MRYETSYESMIGNQKRIWEDLIKGCTKLLGILKEINPGQYYVMKYTYVLFGLRTAKDGFDNLMDIAIKVYSSNIEGYYVDAYEIHKLIKHYLGDIDSTLDYLHKFLNELKLNDKNKKIIKFDREDEEFARQINYFRNEVMHEGVATVSFGKIREPKVQHSDFDGHTFYTGYNIIVIRFNQEFNNKDIPLDSLLESTYYETNKKVQEITDILLEKLSN